VGAHHRARQNQSTPFYSVLSHVFIPVQAGFAEPLMLLGGGTLENGVPGSGSGSSMINGLMTPLSDVWLLDTGPSSSAAVAGDRSAEFGAGKGAVLRIDLPAWCATVEALGSLWVGASPQSLRDGRGISSCLPHGP
jgi:hypothetical protein